MPVLIGLILFAVITFLTLTIKNKSVDKVIKQEAIQCIEGSKEEDSMGDCRVLNIHSAYIDSKENNTTVIFYDQGIGKGDHVVEIKNNIVVDHTSKKINGISFNDLKNMLKKNNACIIYEATIYRYKILQRKKNLTCRAIEAVKYDEYLTKVINYKNDNLDILESSACSKIYEKKGEN